MLQARHVSKIGVVRGTGGVARGVLKGSAKKGAQRSKLREIADRGAADIHIEAHQRMSPFAGVSRHRVGTGTSPR